MEQLLASGHTYEAVMEYDLVQLIALATQSQKAHKARMLELFSLTRAAFHADDKTVKDLINSYQE